MYCGWVIRSLRTAYAFPVVVSLPLKIALFFRGREATTGNASAVRRLSDSRQTLQLDLGNFCSSNFFESVFRLTITA